MAIDCHGLVDRLSRVYRALATREGVADEFEELGNICVDLDRVASAYDAQAKELAEQKFVSEQLQKSLDREAAVSAKGLEDLSNLLRVTAYSDMDLVELMRALWHEQEAQDREIERLRDALERIAREYAGHASASGRIGATRLMRAALAPEPDGKEDSEIERLESLIPCTISRVRESECIGYIVEIDPNNGPVLRGKTLRAALAPEPKGAA